MAEAYSQHSTWHFNHDTTDLVKAVEHVLSVQSDSKSPKIRTSSGHSDFHDIKPVAIYDSPEAKICGAAWHRGQAYEYVVIGRPASLIQYCDLSSGERESIMLNSRRISTDDDGVFAVAVGVSSTLYPTLPVLHQAERLRMCGAVSFATS